MAVQVHDVEVVGGVAEPHGGSSVAIGEHHDADLPPAALQMAVAVRGGKLALLEVLMNTDQGSEYTAKNSRAACARVGNQQTMGRAGSALNSAVIESWHSTAEFKFRPARALHHQAAGPPPSGGLNRGVQPRPAVPTLGIRSQAAYELRLLRQPGAEPEFAA